MKKNLKFILPVLIIGSFLFFPNFNGAAAASGLNNVKLSISPRVYSLLSSWTLSFEMPKTTQVGYIEISLGGSLPSLANSTITVTGISGGHGVIGKTNKNCVSNCDDIKYFLDKPVSVPANTKIVFTINSVQNPASGDNTGISFINVFSSVSPQRTLAFSSANVFLSLSGVKDEDLIPPSATSEENGGITGIVLNDLFYQQGSKTTKLSAIKDAANVQNFTLDLIGKERVTFKGAIDLSQKKATDFITNLSEYLTFDHLDFKVDKDFYNYFKVPLAITYYDVPFVYDPDVLKDGKVVIKDKLNGYNFFVIDGKTNVNLTINEAGEYKLVPHFELNIEDNQLVSAEKNATIFSGRISDSGAKIIISLNGQEVKDAVSSIDPQSGSFSFTLDLADGTNLIEANAQSAYGDIDKIIKTVQYQSALKKTTAEKSKISPYNIAAIVLALVAILMIWRVYVLTRKKRKYPRY